MDNTTRMELLKGIVAVKMDNIKDAAMQVDLAEKAKMQGETSLATFLMNNAKARMEMVEEAERHVKTQMTEMSGGEEPKAEMYHHACKMWEAHTMDSLKKRMETLRG